MDRNKIIDRLRGCILLIAALITLNLWLWEIPSRCPREVRATTLYDAHAEVDKFIGLARDRLAEPAKTLSVSMAGILIPNNQYSVLFPMIIWQAGDWQQGFLPQRLITDGVQRSLYQRLYNENCLFETLDNLELSGWKLDLQLRGIQSFALCRISSNPLRGIVAFGWNGPPPAPADTMADIVNVDIHSIREFFFAQNQNQATVLIQRNRE